MKGEVVEFGPYRIVRRLAAGGMGEVFLARLQRAGGFQKEVAVKSIHPKYMTNPRFIEFFEREARLAALLNHRHIVQIFDFGRDESRVWLAMEYVEGVDLKTVMTHLNGPLPLRVCLDVIQAVAKALHYAHRAKDGRGKRLEIVHRDISPQNIMLSFEGDVKVADFGLAHAAALGPDEDRSLKGKYAYMSPEQVSGIPVDARTDQFSLGTVFYEILAGQRGFHDKAGVSETLGRVQAGVPGDGFDTLRDTIPDSVVSIVERALRPHRTERFPDLGAFVDAVRAASAALSDVAPPVDLSDWLKELFPNRKVSVGSTTVEATRTALADEPIIVRPEAEQSVAMNESAMAAFVDATTGSHRADIDAYPKRLNRITQSLPAVSRTISKVGRSSVMVVLLSAVLTSALLSYIFLPRSLENMVNESVISESTSPETVTVTTPEKAMTDMRILGRDQEGDSLVLDSADVGKSDVTVDFSLPDLGSKTVDAMPKPSAKPVFRKRRSKPAQAQNKRVKPSKSKKVRTASSVGAVEGRSDTKVAPTTPLTPKVDTQANRPSPDAAMPNTPSVSEQSVVKESPDVLVPSLRLLTGGIEFTTKATKKNNGGHRISSTGDLFQVTVNGIKVSLRLSAPRGRFLLSAQARPWANIVVDGRALGGTPLAAFPLASGTHEIVFSTAEGKRAALRIALSR